MKTSAYCRETTHIPIVGAGAAGVHANTVCLMPGCFCITGGGTAGGATCTVKLSDQAGNLFDIPNVAGTAAATIPGAYPVMFHCPGLTLHVDASGAGADTAMLFTVAPCD